MEGAMAKDLQSIRRQCDFCESSLDQIKKSLLVYLKKKSESKHTHHMSTMLKNVASTETNVHLRSSFFKCSEAYAELDSLLTNYSECETQQKSLLAEANKLLITPIRDTLADCNNALKTSAKGTKKTKTNHEIRTTANDDSEVNQRVLHQANILPHHADMFEKHRLIYMKGILKSVLSAELQYHCQAIEKLSPLFECLAQVEEEVDDEEGKERRGGCAIRAFQAGLQSQIS